MSTISTWICYYDSDGNVLCELENGRWQKMSQNEGYPFDHPERFDDVFCEEKPRGVSKHKVMDASKMRHGVEVEGAMLLRKIDFESEVKGECEEAYCAAMTEKVDLLTHNGWTVLFITSGWMMLKAPLKPYQPRSRKSKTKATAGKKKVTPRKTATTNTKKTSNTKQTKQRKKTRTKSKKSK